MNQEKLEIITKLFEGKEIRSVWNSDKEDYYFSVVDVVGILSGTSRPRKYWNDLNISGGKSVVRKNRTTQNEIF